MLRDCLRCGTGWHDPLGVAALCICTGMTDEQAHFVKSLHEYARELRRVARLAVGAPEDLTDEQLQMIGIYLD